MISLFSRERFFLSNFSPSRVTMYGEVYPSVEHAFHAAKWPPVVGDATRSRINAQMRERIRRAPTPAIAKQYGHIRLPSIRVDWDSFRDEAMLLLLRRKFGAEEMAGHPELAAEAFARGALLLATAPHVLVEGNGWGDEYWGAVWKFPTRVDAVETVWGKNGAGELLAGVNRLGVLLMQVRDEIE